MVNSGPLTAFDNQEGMKKVTAYLEQQGQGRFQITYRLRDWLISRQRYWGAPIPIIYCDKCGAVPVPEAELPVELPLEVELSGNRVPSLAQYAAFVNVNCPTCGSPARGKPIQWIHLSALPGIFYAIPVQRALMFPSKAAT
jgi:leucyl-tRNA synthetase